MKYALKSPKTILTRFSIFIDSEPLRKAVITLMTTNSSDISILIERFA